MDSYRIIAAPSEGQYTEKRSRFLAFARPIASEEEARAIVKDFQNRYHDARHVCFAYVLGTDAEVFRANDGGEPSGTAGRPILGQIRSLELTNVLVVVVRYFGGIQLGAANLGVAYKTAARAALDAAEVREEIVRQRLRVEVPYADVDVVMRTLKKPNVRLLAPEYTATSSILTAEIPRSEWESMRAAIAKIHTAKIFDED